MDLSSGQQRKTHPPPTLNTNLAGGDGGIASWPLHFEKKIRASGNLKIIIQSFKLPNNMLMPMIAGVGAPLANSQHTRKTLVQLG